MRIVCCLRHQSTEGPECRLIALGVRGEDAELFSVCGYHLLPHNGLWMGPLARSDEIGYIRALLLPFFRSLSIILSIMLEILIV